MKEQIKELQTATDQLLKKLNDDVNVMNKKLDKNKVNMVTEFIDKQETKRINTLQSDYEEQHK